MRTLDTHLALTRHYQTHLQHIPVLSFRQSSPVGKILRRTLPSYVAQLPYASCDAGLGGGDTCPIVSPSSELRLCLLRSSVVVTTVRGIAPRDSEYTASGIFEGRNLIGPGRRVTHGQPVWSVGGVGGDICYLCDDLLNDFRLFHTFYSLHSFSLFEVRRFATALTPA